MASRHLFRLEERPFDLTPEMRLVPPDVQIAAAVTDFAAALAVHHVPRLASQGMQGIEIGATARSNTPAPTPVTMLVHKLMLAFVAEYSLPRYLKSSSDVSCVEKITFLSWIIP